MRKGTRFVQTETDSKREDLLDSRYRYIFRRGWGERPREPARWYPHPAKLYHYRILSPLVFDFPIIFL